MMRLLPQVIWPTLGSRRVNRDDIIRTFEDYMVVREERLQYRWWKAGILEEKMKEEEEKYWKKVLEL